MARAGETVELAPRDGHDPRARRSLEWDDTDPDRPIAIVDVVCSAGTYVRALARDLGETLGSAAYLGALVRTASGPFALDDARRRSTRSATRRPPGRTGSLPLLQPIDAGLEAFPDGRADRRTRPWRSPAASSCRPAPGCRRQSRPLPAASAPDGALVAIACLVRRPARPGQGVRGPGARRGRRALTPPMRRRRRRRRAAARRRRPRSSSSSASSTASTSAIATCSSTSSREAGRRGAAADRDHLRPPPRRGPDRERAAAPDRPGRAARSGSTRPAWR